MVVVSLAYEDVIVKFTGLGFVPATQVQIAGVTIPDSLVTYKNHTTLEVRLRGAVETASAFADSIRVINPAPGGGESEALPFSVNSPQAQLVGINPTSLWLHSTGGVVTLLGGNFIPGAVVHLEKNTGEQTTLATTFVNSTTLLVTFAAEEVDSVELYQVRVENPQPTLGISQTQVLKVIRRVPVVQAITPETIQADTQPVVLTLTGDHFVPESEVFVDGVAVSTTFVSVTELQFSYSSTLSTTLTVTVQTLPDAITQAGGGASGSVMLTVQPGMATQIEFTGLPVTGNVAYALQNFSINLKDQFGNPTDSELTLAYSNADQTSTGTISLTRTALGTSTATQVVFYQAGVYTLSAGGLSMTGNNQITIEAGSVVAQISAAGLPETLTAGENLPELTLLFSDQYGNAIDAAQYTDKVGVVVTPFGGGNSYRLTLTASQPQPGTLTTSAMQVTTAGPYSLVIESILDNLIIGTKALVVNPSTITQAEFTGVPAEIQAGQALPAFTVKFTDVYQNPVDVETGVTYTNADASTSSATPNTGTITLTRTAVGVSTATQTTFTQAGAYTLSVANIPVVGNTQFSVSASQTVASILVENLSELVTAGSDIPAFTIKLYDQFGNPPATSDYTGKFSFLVTALGTTATYMVDIPVAETQPGTLSAAALAVTTAGTYQVRYIVPQIALSGSTTLTVQAGIATESEFIVTNVPVILAEPFEVTVKMKDQYGNPTAYSGANSLEIYAEDASLVETIPLNETGMGEYKGTITFAQTGLYSFNIAGIMSKTGTSTIQAFDAYSISGLVTDGNGSPVQGVQFSLTFGTKTRTATTDVSGMYVLSGIPPGLYQVQPDPYPGHGFIPGSRSVEIIMTDVEDVNFTMAPAYSISGVSQLDGVGHSGVVITLIDVLNNQVVMSTVSSITGTYIFPVVTSGSYSIVASANGYAVTPNVRVVQVSNANITQQNFSLIPQVNVSGLVQVNTTGLSGVSVILMNTSGTIVVSTTTTVSGAYTLTGVSSGTYTIFSQLAGYTFAPQAITVTLATMSLSQQNFTAYQVYTVQGTTMLNGMPLSGVIVQLLYQGLVIGTTSSSVSGVYEFKNITSGTWQFYSAADAGRPRGESWHLRSQKSCAVIPVEQHQTSHRKRVLPNW